MINDPDTRAVVERPTLIRRLPPVRFTGTRATTEWLLDRPVLAATLARHLHPPLEQYRIMEKGQGRYEVTDGGAVKGVFRLVARGADRRAYLCQGQFRSLARLVTLSGSLVFTLEYHEQRDGSASFMEVTPHLFIRLDSLLAHGVFKPLGPLLHGTIDRRSENLKAATRILARRLAEDPRGLYQELRTWPDVRPEDAEDFRRAFLGGEGGP